MTAVNLDDAVVLLALAGGSVLLPGPHPPQERLEMVESVAIAPSELRPSPPPARYIAHGGKADGAVSGPVSTSAPSSGERRSR